jgi:hypothetical protein
MREISGVLAVSTFAARLLVRRAEKALRKPEGESLLSNTTWSVKEQTAGKLALVRAVAE